MSPGGAGVMVMDMRHPLLLQGEGWVFGISFQELWLKIETPLKNFELQGTNKFTEACHLPSEGNQ